MRDSLVAADAACGLVVAPMTLVVPAYAEEILGGLAERGVEARHVILDASPETLEARLRGRASVWRGREAWAMAQIERCTQALASMPGDRVFTDALDHDQVVEAIADVTGVTLVHPRLGGLRRRAQTLVNQVRVIRL